MDYHGLQMEWNGGTYHLFAYHFLFCFVWLLDSISKQVLCETAIISAAMSPIILSIVEHHFLPPFPDRTG